MSYEESSHDELDTVFWDQTKGPIALSEVQSPEEPERLGPGIDNRYSPL